MWRWQFNMSVIILTAEDKKKLDILDTFFNSLNSEELENLASQDRIASKLKGEPERRFLTNLIQSVNCLSGSLAKTEFDTNTLREDFRLALRALQQIRSKFADIPYSSEFENLKIKHNIY